MYFKNTKTIQSRFNIKRKHKEFSLLKRCSGSIKQQSSITPILSGRLIKTRLKNLIRDLLFIIGFFYHLGSALYAYL